MNQKFITNDPQKLREKFIEKLAKSEDSTQSAKELANELYALDLTVYSRDFSFNSLVYNSFARSVLDENIAMHPEQLQIIKEIEENDAVIVSAPTSFGKTFSVFEYIARSKPNNIVLVVPTLALVDEYMKKLIKKYTNFFSGYKIYSQLDVDAKYDFLGKNIFVLTHDRVVLDEVYKTIEVIDLLVIDEVYKLETDSTNDRVLVLNMAYYYLSQKAKKYILLAPFVNNIEDIDMLEKRPHFYKTEYSPVVNRVHTIEILNSNDRNPQCNKLLSNLSSEDKTLIYFPAVTGIYKYVNDFISKEELIDDLDDSVASFILWAKEEIHEEWSVVKALERGYTIHNGQIPLGIRLYQLNLYEHNQSFNRMLCTSTLLEGVNTSAKNIIIVSPSRTSMTGEIFSAFDFFNLVGRTGRLNQHYIGDAYYLRAPDDPVYNKNDAIRSIRFEITDSSQDIDIQKGEIENHEEYLGFLSLLGISHDDYIKNIGNHFRFVTVRALYQNYCSYKEDLINELVKQHKEDKRGRYYLVKVLYRICQSRLDGLEISLITSLLNRTRPKLHKIVDDAMKYFSSRGIDNIISKAIKMKTSYIEHEFYAKTMLIKYFLNIDRIDNSLIGVLDDKVINAIDYLYFSDSKQKRMLLDIGIYERDIEKIISVIGNDFLDVFEMKKRLIDNARKIKNIGFISQFIIKNL